jgi:hypothetical protein
MTLRAEDLPKATRKRLGLRKPRSQNLKREAVRREALAVLAVIRHLTASERRRVLEHALKVNEV